MIRKHVPHILALLVATTLVGCYGRLDATPAPTTVPLPAGHPAVELATPTSTAIPQEEATAAANPTPTPLATMTAGPMQPTATMVAPAATTTAVLISTPQPGSAPPTRVVSPQETISLPPGFGISVFVSGLDDPRMMALGPDGEVYVAERGKGRVVRLPDRNGDGVADGSEVVADGLRAPSSIAFLSGSLYVGETTRIVRLSDPDESGVYHAQETVIDGLPSGGHNTRTVLFSPDGSSLLVSIGSSCNACVESDERRAAIVRYNPDGSGGQVYAHGLRNAVGIAFRPGTDELWATDNGRDYLGDDQPPETVYLVREGDDAGWPRCHAGRIVDPEFGGPGACDGVVIPAVEMQAHSAPLGLAFYTGQQFPQEYRGNLFVAFHGSWNRSVPTGYKVVRIPMNGGQPGPVSDFAVGWLRADGSNWGRPVDVLSGPDGSLYISDDAYGVIYRVFYAGK